MKQTTPQPLACFECETGHLRTEILAYETFNARNELLIITAIPHEVCDKCGEICLSAAACRMIEAAREATGVKYRNPPRRIKSTHAEKEET